MDDGQKQVAAAVGGGVGVYTGWRCGAGELLQVWRTERFRVARQAGDKLVNSEVSAWLTLVTYIKWHPEEWKFTISSPSSLHCKCIYNKNEKNKCTSEKLMAVQQVKKSLVFLDPSLRCLQKASWIQLRPSHPITFTLILILSSNLCLGVPSGQYCSEFVTEVLHEFLTSSFHATCLVHLS